MKKSVLYASVAVIILGTAGYFWLSGSASKEIKYRTEKVSRGTVVVQVRATGTINPVQTVQVGSQVSGTISKIYVDFNSEVKRGQIIAFIDSTFLYASVKEAEANLSGSRAKMEEAKRTLNRTTELNRKNLVAQADLDAATATYESASAQLQQSQASLDRANVNIRYAVIRAPIDGVIISRDVDVGQTVAASFATPKLFSIANDLRRMRVEASIDEADIGQVKTGQDVTFSVDTYPEEQFRGVVTQIRLNPVTVQNVVTYMVIIEVANPDLKLRPGMTATVSILVEKRNDALRVPTLAMRFQPPQEALDKQQDQKVNQPGEQKEGQSSPQAGTQQSERAKWRERGELKDGEHRQMEMHHDDRQQKKMSRIWFMDASKNLKSTMVQTGLNDNRYVEIISGDLKEGDEVIIGMSSAEMTSGPGSQTNPFQPRMGGPGGGGGGRRGM